MMIYDSGLLFWPHKPKRADSEITFDCMRTIHYYN